MLKWWKRLVRKLTKTAVTRPQGKDMSAAITAHCKKVSRAHGGKLC